MAEYQIGHIYLWLTYYWTHANQYQLIRVTSISVRFCQNYRFLVSYHLLAVDESIEYIKIPHTFLCNSLEIERGTKEVPFRDLPLYIGYKTILPEFKKLLTA